MRILLQRVSRAEVRAAGVTIGAIEHGLVALVGIGPADDEVTVDALARRIVALRLFRDPAGLTNLALAEVGGSVLVVSQFTLYADTRRGRRPGFTGAADPAHAEALVARLAATIAALGVRVAMGRFGAEMEVELVNDGPFTIWLDSAER